MKNAFGVAAVFGLALVGSLAHATPSRLQWIEGVHITYIGCHELPSDSGWPNANYPTSCIVGTDLAAKVGPASCMNTEFRFNAGYANGKNVLSIATAAFLSGKPVAIEVSTTCDDAFPSFPTFLTLIMRQGT